jgi:hypothetical protein
MRIPTNEYKERNNKSWEESYHRPGHRTLRTNGRVSDLARG